MSGITAPEGKVADTFLVGNVGWNDSTPTVFPPEQSGLFQSDNISCKQACFGDPANFDFSPVSGSALDRHAVTFQAKWLPEVDFFGNPRKSPPRAGAVESVGQPWRVP